MKAQSLKFKVQKPNSKFKIFWLVLFILTFNFTLLILKLNSAQATSPTPTITPTPTTNPVRETIKKIVNEKLDQTQKGQKIAFFGTISEINNLSITLQTKEGSKKLEIATDAALIGKGGKKINLEDIKKGLFSIAMGFMGENNILNVRRLVIGEKPKTSEREIAFGKITDISKEENVITIKNEKKNIIYTVETNEKTTLTKKVEGKIQKVKLSAVETGDRLVVVGTPTENEHKLITAKIIHILPGLTEKETETTSTPSSQSNSNQ